MRLRPVLTVLTLTLLARGAGAQAISRPPARGPTDSGPPTLQLSAHATIKLAPDELVADLTALAKSPAAVAAQRRVNTLMAQASKAAAAVTGVEASFKDYSVVFTDERPPHWIAQQTVELKAKDSEALLDVVGRLQALGLAIGGLDWQVSAERAEKARQEAAIAALKRLRTQAAEDADALGMQIDRFRSVRVNGGPRPIPLFRDAVRSAMPMAAATAPPRATPEQQDITADVSAEILLRIPPPTRSPIP